MTPLEAMAKARWEHINDVQWEKMSDQLRSEDMRAMRAALLALSEAENLPLDWIAGDDKQAARIKADFRETLQSIAKQS